jgi:ANTAR domain
VHILPVLRLHTGIFYVDGSRRVSPPPCHFTGNHAVTPIPVGEAFEVLRRHARSHAVSLRSVAEAVVSLGLRP